VEVNVAAVTFPERVILELVIFVVLIFSKVEFVTIALPVEIGPETTRCVDISDVVNVAIDTFVD
jgi:hypothetical protein